MGAEATCRVTFKGKSGTGRARLETDVLQFRSVGLRLSIAFREMSNVAARSGALKVTFPGGTASFQLGAAAERWARKILHPPSRLEKIGVKAGWNVSAVGVRDAPFLEELSAVAGTLAVGRVVKDSDAIFVGATKASDLDRLFRLKAMLKPAGALWVIRPKGPAGIPERAVMAAGRAAGLVDVKVVSFSSTHTAEKFMIPVSHRG